MNLRRNKEDASKSVVDKHICPVISTTDLQAIYTEIE